MTSIVSTGAANKKTLNTLQKTFNRLKKKIVGLRKQLKEREEMFEKGFELFQTEVSPLQSALMDTISEFVKILYSHYKKPKGLSKNDKTFLKQIIIEHAQGVLAFSSALSQIDVEVQQILKDLEGVDCQDVYQSDLEEGKAMIAKMCKDLNLDVDLSSIDLSDDRDAILQKVFEAMSEARQRQGDDMPPPSRSKTQKELEKEAKARELEHIQKEGVGKLYKQLAKALHPDLEQNPAVKAEKEELMKRLTTAYSNEDLHELLSIEMEWFNCTDSDESEGKLPSDEQLKIFNSLLNDQVKELEDSIRMIASHPKFSYIQLLNLNDIRDILPELKNLHKGLKRDLRNFQELIKDVSAGLTEQFFIMILRENQWLY